MRHFEDMLVKSRTSVLVSCVLTTLLAGTAAHGQAIGWGDDSQGQASVAGIGRMRKASSGFAHTLLLTGCGDVTAVGFNAAGQASVPIGLPAIMDIAAGGEHSVAVDFNGVVVCWGANGYQQCTVPAGLGGVTDVAAGAFHTIASTPTGLVMWGLNTSGQCNAPAGLGVPQQVEGGALHTLAISVGGRIHAWGDNSYGQSLTPQVTAKKISAGFIHSLAITKAGTVAAWGDNSAGQCNVPPQLADIVDIAAGGFFSIALDSNNKIHVWGDASAGQFDVPTDFNAAPTISAGYAHAVAAFECPADLNGDGVVDLNDVAIVLAGWGGPNGDVDCDGITNGIDYVMVLSSLGSCM